ncbi:ABC transporter permease [Aminivibrio sp.]|jgi:putative hydroxymethylpyrimidine transport system permease protein|uniref:ABC transporter permease n=1 Tax=Aminivibrio sp. TaxID=1872489 RepID=UPI0016959AE7|nr:ABC transporter permease [Synergistaceae bacterium]
MKSRVLSLVFFGAFLLSWEFFCHAAEIQPFILPAPSRILRIIAEEAPLLLRHGAATAIEILLGTALSVTAAVILAAAMFIFPAAEKALAPLLVASQAIPVFALAPLLVAWLGYGMGSKILMAAVIIFFPVTVSLLQGFKSCDADLARLFSAMGAGTWKTFRLLYWPWAMPYFFAGLRVAVSVAAIGAVIGEWVGSMRGLGFLMMQANARLRTDLVFASIAVLSALSIFLWKIVCFFEKKCVHWSDTTNSL